MKKLFALLIAVAMVITASVSVFADFLEFDEEPTSYFWLKANSTTTPTISFKVPGSVLPANGEVTLAAKVLFEEDITGGDAYLNCYAYDDETKFNDFDYLVNFKDFAKSSDTQKGIAEDNTEADLPVLGKWVDFEYTFDPHNADYASGRASSQVEITGGKAIPEMLTIGLGYGAGVTGTIKLASLSLRANNEVIWSMNFAGGFDIDDEKDAANVAFSAGVTAKNYGINWGAEYPEDDINGTNIAEGKDCTIVCVVEGGDFAPVDNPFSQYNADLTDGIAGVDKSYNNSWFAFHAGSSEKDSAVVGVEIDGDNYTVAKAIVDLGSVQDFSKVRANCWSAGASGICVIDDIVLHISDDKENWTEIGSLLIGPEGEVWWAETSDSMEMLSARYVMLEYRWAAGTAVWCFTNEIQVIQNDVVNTGDDESEPAGGDESEPEQGGDESEPAGDESEDEGQGGQQGGNDPAPQTGDAGIIALAVVSVIALGGAVIVKKSK